MQLYKTLENIITATTISDKISLFNSFYERYRSGDIDFSYSDEPLIFSEPSYSSFCTIADPKAVPKRSRFNTPHGQKLLVHAIAHIEYSAIDLALDAVYRFRDVPRQFIDDWLEVADDEVRHFIMLEDILKELGGYYGEFEVHDSLFEASMRTLELDERMAVVPRYLEANGLDATPQILKKLYPLRDDVMVAKIIAALEIILTEEVEHVRKGDRWFEYATKNSSSDSYFEIINRHYPRSFPRKIEINCSARKEAGFSESELKIIGVC